MAAPPDSPPRTSGRVAAPAAALGLLLAVVLSACGSPRTLDGTSAAQQITRSLSSRFPGADPRVRCPSGVAAEVGQRFACSATLDGQALPIQATVTDASGQFQPVLGAAVIQVAEAETALAADVTAQVKHPAQVACGTAHSLLVERPGQQFSCTATIAGLTHTLDVTVTDVAGRVTFRLGSTTVASGSAPSTTATIPGDG
jgi:hypothetical protein